MLTKTLTDWITTLFCHFTVNLKKNQMAYLHRKKHGWWLLNHCRTAQNASSLFCFMQSKHKKPPLKKQTKKTHYSAECK